MHPKRSETCESSPVDFVSVQGKTLLNRNISSLVWNRIKNRWLQGQHWPAKTLPPNSLPPNMAATNLRWSEVPLHCEIVQKSFDNIKHTERFPIKISLFYYNTT